jgi:hypothetical protein
MSRNAWKWLLVVCCSLVPGETLWVSSARATPANDGFKGVTTARGLFDEFDVLNHAQPNEFPPAQTDRWMSLQKTKGQSDLYVQSNTWQPGGSTGWHSHPGHSLIIVTAGTITVYDGDDPSCTPRTYTAGQGLIDHGGDHAHVIRNEDPNVVAQTIAVQILPKDAPRRLDKPASEACHPSVQ